MASVPVDTVTIANAKPRAQARRRRLFGRPRRNGWLHLLFGSGPCWYRLLRFGQRHRD